jgi:hypothetical protein
MCLEINMVTWFSLDYLLHVSFLLGDEILIHISVYLVDQVSNMQRVISACFESIKLESLDFISSHKNFAIACYFQLHPFAGWGIDD